MDQSFNAHISKSERNFSFFQLLFIQKETFFWSYTCDRELFFTFCSLIEELAKLITLSHFIQSPWILGKDEKLSRAGKRCVRRVHFH